MYRPSWPVMPVMRARGTGFDPSGRAARPTSPRPWDRGGAVSRSGARPLLVLALGALVGSVAVVAAWVVDSRAHRDAVLPNVALAGRSVRGMTREELDKTVQATAARFASASVEVRAPGGGFDAQVPELGVAVAEGRTVDAALRAGRTGSPPRRLWSWARSFLFPVQLPDADKLAAQAEQLASGGLKVAVGEQVAQIPAASLRSWLQAVPAADGLQLGLKPNADVMDGLAELLPDVGTKPADAGFSVSGGRVSVTPGKTGTACCAPEARDAIKAAL